MRDDHVDAAAKGVFLRPHADAAEYRRRRERRVNGQVVQVLDNLRGQLARRRQHQRTRDAARLVDQLMKNRQQERRRLTAAGRGASPADRVPAWRAESRPTGWASAA